MKEALKQEFLRTYNIISKSNPSFELKENTTYGKDKIFLDYKITGNHFNITKGKECSFAIGVIFHNEPCTDYDKIGKLKVYHIGDYASLEMVLSLLNEYAISLIEQQSRIYQFEEKLKKYVWGWYEKNNELISECFGKYFTISNIPIAFYNNGDMCFSKQTAGMVYNINGQITLMYSHPHSVRLILYLNDDIDTVEMQHRTARHEIIHYLLDASGVDGGDTSVWFWIFCAIYDGGAYQPLNQADETIYKWFLKIKKIIDKEVVKGYLKKVIYGVPIKYLYKTYDGSMDSANLIMNTTDNFIEKYLSIEIAKANKTNL